VTYDRPEHERRAEGLHHSETLARQRDRCHQRRHAVLGGEDQSGAGSVGYCVTASFTRRKIQPQTL